MRAMLATSIIMMLLITFGCQSEQQVPFRLKASQFVVVDQFGNQRAVLGVFGQPSDVNSPVELLLQDAEQGPRARVTVAHGGSTNFEFLDSGGEARIELELGTSGEPIVQLLDRTGQRRIRISLDEIGRPSVALLNAKNTGAVYMGEPSESQRKILKSNGAPVVSDFLLAVFGEGEEIVWKRP
ncbi:MAG: hypothetical protein HN341_09835 [Verrucomicrobia bacterium]|jgi:hypothetical protein|nr:hypothetical protein [Verrucomicrobiota bacterium]